ncbi:hypothetical protein ACIRG5_36360 [Lentzea sp. NPDC102401]|uniref:hypothetical protein n=1 Tax=Lentzea sp. NPDC102401 TaxID=3364128 RepID=UPI0037F46FD2
MKMFNRLATALTAAGLLLGAAVVAAPAASATGCSQGSGYRNCRYDYNGDFVSVTAYPGIIKAGLNNSRNVDVWIDSDRTNHLAAGRGYAEYRYSGSPLRWRGCSWFYNQFGDRFVACTPWVQGY